MKNGIVKSLIILAFLSMTSFGANILLNPGFDTGTGVDADNWTQAGNANRETWGQHTGTAGMMFQNWAGSFGDIYQVVSENVPNGDTVMLKFYAKASGDALFDAGAEVYARIELKNGVSLVEIHNIQVLPQLTNSIDNWLDFDYRIVNTNDNIDTIVAKFVVSGITGGIVDIDDTILDFGSGLQEPSFEEDGIWWDLTGNCGIEGWAARTGSDGVAFYGWTAGGTADISQEIVTNCTPINGKQANITFSIYAKAEADYYSTSGNTKLSLSFTGSTETEEMNIHTELTNSPNTWNKYSVAYNNLSETISKVNVSFSGADFAAPGGSQAAMFDDAELTITWIPEPVGLFFIGLIGIAIIRSRLRLI